MTKTQNDYNKAWRDKNPEKARLQRARYRKRHRPEIRAREQTAEIRRLAEKIKDNTELTLAKLKLLGRYQKLYCALHGKEDDDMLRVMREIDMSLKR